MLWHHLLVDKKVVRSIYESFGENARPIIEKAMIAFPQYAWQIANSTLVGESEPYGEDREENIISVYSPNAPEWYHGPADHHCMKLHMDSGIVKWKVLWTPPYKLPKIQGAEGTCKWIGQNFDENHQPENEYHEYYDEVSKSNPRDLIGYTCTNDLEIKHTKIYVHPHWVTQGEYLVTNWDHLQNIELPEDYTYITNLTRTKGDQWIN